MSEEVDMINQQTHAKHFTESVITKLMMRWRQDGWIHSR